MMENGKNMYFHLLHYLLVDTSILSIPLFSLSVINMLVVYSYYEIGCLTCEEKKFLGGRG